MDSSNCSRVDQSLRTPILTVLRNHEVDNNGPRSRESGYNDDFAPPASFAWKMSVVGVIHGVSVWVA